MKRPRTRSHRAAARPLGLVAILAVALVLSGAAAATAATVTPSRVAPAVAPYLEMGGPHPGNLDAAIDAGLSSVTAAFVIGRGCTPVWDDGVPVARDTAVTKAIQDAQASGVSVIVSFGGAGGKDLARTCKSLPKLVAAYQGVISRFGLTQVDFDVEGDAIDPRSEHASIARRFSAIRALAGQNAGLSVSATIGVGPSGLVPDGVRFLRVAKGSATTIDLVDVMTMDYGGPVADMGATAVSAAKGTLAQLQRLWPGDTYANLAITPMIGKNDSAGETTTQADARTIVAFAADHQVGRLAFWSLNRDQQCGSKALGARGGCSGVQQSPLAFTGIFLGG